MNEDTCSRFTGCGGLYLERKPVDEKPHEILERSLQSDKGSVCTCERNRFDGYC
ncbi:hypothetical protein BDK88_0045 [Natrinema hispanicum]|uniref:Uncharacterized protein n=1 Tax=Natrinema hispanicum TaxID=392421 RepID=A0A482YDS7_9EURY|nr:hypothetical protein BDK88_0045 [Natrinema hispanicum]